MATKEKDSEEHHGEVDEQRCRGAQYVRDRFDDMVTLRGENDECHKEEGDERERSDGRQELALEECLRANDDEKAPGDHCGAERDT